MSRTRPRRHSLARAVARTLSYPTPVEADIPLCGGIVHIVDQPIFSNGPPQPDPNAAFEGTPAFDEFDCNPLEYIGSRDDLTILSSFFDLDQANNPNFYAGGPPDVYTFFLPTDAAFERAFAANNFPLEGLLDFFSSSEPAAENLNYFLVSPETPAGDLGRAAAAGRAVDRSAPRGTPPPHTSSIT